MPAQLVSQANPPADRSLLPASVLDYGVVVATENFLPPDELESIQQFRRAADYIAAGLYLILTPQNFCLCLSSNDLSERQCFARERY